MVQRGVAYWTDGDEDERIFWGTGNGYLVCVEAKTGRPCPDFGPGGSGMVDAMAGIPRATRGERDYSQRAAVGHSLPADRRPRHGDPRVPRGRPAHHEGSDSGVGARVGRADRRPRVGLPHRPERRRRVRGGHLAQRLVALLGERQRLVDAAGDNELGHVYLPTGTVTNDYYGANRLGDNLFSESIIAVDVETGQRVWHFQAVHHGLWDYDFATHSNLVDITVDGREIKALAQVSKQGFVYVFDRVTGEPVWPIEERPVPQETHMPGEVPSPTQPFPTKPAPFDYQG